tara:strand:- start:413 stop:604 length:192 start_codon:yes stop_codon:yes gene_type:complete
LIKRVRWRMRRSRVSWSIRAACRSSDDTATKRIVGRVAASAIASASASASAASVFPRFTYAFT